MKIIAYYGASAVLTAKLPSLENEQKNLSTDCLKVTMKNLSNRQLVNGMRGTMKKSNDNIRGIRWDLIFERRPDLAPPGYSELLAQIRSEQTKQKEETNGKHEA